MRGGERWDLGRGWGECEDGERRGQGKVEKRPRSTHGLLRPPVATTAHPAFLSLPSFQRLLSLLHPLPAFLLFTHLHPLTPWVGRLPPTSPVAPVRGMQGLLEGRGSGDHFPAVMGHPPRPLSAVLSSCSALFSFLVSGIKEFPGRLRSGGLSPWS